MKNTALLFVVLICGITTRINAQAILPPLFTDNLVSTGWNNIEGIMFDSTGQGYAWEKNGFVWIVDTNNVKLPFPLIDISDEVGDWRDHGLNGFCLDPHFRNNGYFYLYYTVDRHHLIYYGTPNYNPNTNDYFSATIARVTRYTADSATNFTTVVPGSRYILIGETKKTGIPVTHETHSGGALLFGRDETLLISTGDGGTPNTADSGSVGVTYYIQALADSIIKPKENVGAYRSQMIDCLNGKILRVDAATGNGLPSNPWFDSTDARQPKSRVWALGLRNPFRMALRPGTGEEDPTAGNPGSIYIGDVGWQFWEDVNVSRTGRENFGWPIYQGFDFDPNYNAARAYNMDAPNPLYGSGGCTQQYFQFHELINNPTLNGIVDFPNPCNNLQQIPDSLGVKFIHARPEIDYSHTFAARTGIWNGNDASTINIDDSLSPVTGVAFGGLSSVAGVFYSSDKMPVQYQGSLFHGDYASAWIKTMQFNTVDSPTVVNHFADSIGAVVWMTEKTNDGCIYYINYPDQIRKFCYTGNVNNPPKAIISADTVYGVQPLTVNFTGSNSTDPEGMPLTYAWDFDDGSIDSIANPSHTFIAPPNIPTIFWVKLTVTDDTLQSNTDSILISVNNTPPAITITSFNNGDLYSMIQTTILPLQASVTDTEHGPSELFYKWQTFLHHNSHIHPEQPDTNRITSTVITPIGCDVDTFYYSIKLTVTDAAGLSASVRNYIYPDCSIDCNGDLNGSAYIDSCGICVGGNTGLSPCVQDCNGVWGGTAYIDTCGICASGNTGIIPCDSLNALHDLPVNKNYFELYPNPAHNKVEIIYTSNLNIKSELQIADIYGRTVIHHDVTNTNQKRFAVDISGIAKGLYIVKLGSGKEVPFTRILIVN